MGVPLDPIYDLLCLFGMNSRAAVLVSPKDFSETILRAAPRLIPLREKKMPIDEDDVLLKERLQIVYDDLLVSDTRSHLVANSKTLHFLLPHLVMPIDRTYTLAVLQINAGSCGVADTKQFELFWQVLIAYSRLAKRLELSYDKLPPGQWNLSLPKYLDNAVIGLLRLVRDEGATAFLPQNVV